MPDIPQNTGTTRPSNQRASTKSTVGISFPFRKEDGEFPKREYDADCVQNDVIALFSQSKRSRIMRPNVGHTAQLVVFESQSALLNARLQRNIRQTIVNNEPRIKVSKIAITTDDTEVTPEVDYVIQGVRDSVTLPAMQTK